MARRYRRPRRRSFPVDVEDHGDEYVVSADLPGLRTQDIEVSVRGSRVRIEVRTGAGTPGGVRFDAESDRVDRVVALPEAVRDRRARAEYLDGVLHVHLPKRTKHPEERTRIDVE